MALGGLQVFFAEELHGGEDGGVGAGGGGVGPGAEEVEAFGRGIGLEAGFGCGEAELEFAEREAGWRVVEDDEGGVDEVDVEKCAVAGGLVTRTQMTELE